MSTYRAIVSIYFDDDDLEDLAKRLNIKLEKLDIHEVVNAELDGIAFSSWTEQIFKDKEPTITRLSKGIKIEINDFD